MERAEQLRIPDPEEPLEGSLAETDPDRHHDHVQLIAEGAPYCTDGEELYVASDVDQVHDLPAMDTLAEMANVVAGQAKGRYEGSPYEFDISTPTVITGSPHHIVHRADLPCYEMAFSSELGPFYLQLSVRGREPGHPAAHVPKA